jgi:hypothetical protein
LGDNDIHFARAPLLLIFPGKMTEDLVIEKKAFPRKISVGEICERFVEAGLFCHMEQNPGEVWVKFENRNASLVFTMSKAGRPLVAELPSTLDYDPHFACILFEVFDSLGWTYEES